MTAESSFSTPLQAATKRLEKLARADAFTTNEGKVFSAILISAKQLADVLGKDEHFRRLTNDGFQRASLNLVEPERAYTAFLGLCALLLAQFLARVRNQHAALLPYLDVPEDRFVADLAKVLSLPEGEGRVSTALSTVALRNDEDPRDQWGRLILETSQFLSDAPIDFAALQKDPSAYMPLTILISSAMKAAVSMFDGCVLKLSITPAAASQFAGNRPLGCGSAALALVALAFASVLSLLLVAVQRI